MKKLFGRGRYNVQPERRQPMPFLCPDCRMQLDYRRDAEGAMAHLRSHRFNVKLAYIERSWS